MKTILSFLFAFIGLVTLSSCGKNTPEDVAERFTNAYYKMDFSKAKELATETSAKQLDMVEQMAATMSDSKKQEAKKVIITMGECKVDSNRAIVYYTSSDEPDPQSVHLVKVDDKWKVEWNKLDNVSGARDKAKTEEAPAPEATTKEQNGGIQITIPPPSK